MAFGPWAFAFRDANIGLGRPNEVQRNLSADLNPVLIPAAVATPAGPPCQALRPLWWLRVWLVLYVLFCAEMGLLLIALPWRAIWKTNRFLVNYPVLHAVFESYFFRGMVTGIGIVDLYLGASAIAHYAVRRQARKPAPPAPRTPSAESRQPE
jgi:hypothetical protein